MNSLSQPPGRRSGWRLALLVLFFAGFVSSGGRLSIAGAEVENALTNKPAGLLIAELKRETSVDFEKEILPVLRDNCLACHNTTKAKGGLNLETPELILKGGDSGPGVVPGKNAESILFKAAAHLDPELIMPPKDNKANAGNLTPEQLALLKVWIDQGAKGEVRSARPVKWLEKPPALTPIFTVAVTRDGQYAACGRGNRIEVYHLPSARRIALLADSSLAALGLAGSAHRDYVNSLAFNPAGTLLASGSYREAKLWRRPLNVQKAPLLLSNGWHTLTLSPDGKWLATDTPAHGIALYSRGGDRPVRILSGHSNSITALCFSPDSLRLGTASLDKSLRIWDVVEGTPRPAIETPSEPLALAWAGDGKVLASGGADGAIQLWDPEDAKLVSELKEHDKPVTALAAVPGRSELISGDAEGVIRLWNLADGKKLQEAKHEGTITALAVRPDGKRFASAGTNGLAKLWNREDAKLVAEMKGNRYTDELVEETERTLTVAKVTTAFHGKSVEAVEAESRKQTDRVTTATVTNAITEKVFLEKEKVLQEAVTAKTAADKAQEDLLAEIKRVTEAFETADRLAKKAAETGRNVLRTSTEAQLTAERASLARSEAGRIATDTASVAAKAKAAVSNAEAARETARRIAEESAAVAEKSKGYAEAVAADAEMKVKFAAEAMSEAEKAIEQVASLSFAAGQLKPAYDKTLAEAPEKRKQATNQITSTTKSLASAELDFKKAETRKSVTAHELELALQAARRASNSVAEAKAILTAAEKQQRQIEGDLSRYRTAATQAVAAIHTLAFSPDNVTLATFGSDQKVHTWSAETGATFEVFPSVEVDAPATIPASGGRCAVFVDANTVMAPGGSRTLAFWDLDPRWNLERTIGSGENDSPLSDRVNAIRFSPDGVVLATGGGEPTRSGETKLWNVMDGKFLREFANIHSDAVLSLDFSPNGQYLASASADRFVRVVSLGTGKLVRAFEGHTSYVLGVAWKADSRTLASAGADNVIKVWDFTSGERRKNIEGAGKEVTSVTFVGVSDQIAASSGDNQVRLVRENGEKVRSFEGAADFMNAVAATPDGSRIVAGGQDGVLRVWNGKDGKLLAIFAPTQGN